LSSNKKQINPDSRQPREKNLLWPSPFRLLSNAFSNFGSVGRRKKDKTAKIKLEKESGARRPGHPSSLKTTRCGYKVNMAAMEEGKIRRRCWNQTRAGKKLKVCKAKYYLRFRLK